jgi:predicted lipoprotein with Yx(FWY)xxD motif
VRGEISRREEQSKLLLVASSVVSETHRDIVSGERARENAEYWPVLPANQSAQKTASYSYIVCSGGTSQVSS